MGPEEIQAKVDETEREATERYRRYQELAAMINDAVRRAESMDRLESALRLATR